MPHQKLAQHIESNLLQPMLTAIQESVRIPSLEAAAEPGKPFGSKVAEALDHALKVSKDLGFHTANIDGYAGYAEYGDGEDYVAVLGHLDVVPEGNGWIHPPYGAEIHDGKLYGRGVLDDKGPIFAALYALKAIKDLNLPLKRRVRIIFGTNEESGCSDMKYYMTKEKPPIAGFTPDAEFPAIHGEKGLLKSILSCPIHSTPSATSVQLLRLQGGERANVVPDFCEALVKAPQPEKIIEACQSFAKAHSFDLNAKATSDGVLIQSKGLGAHGSTPEKGQNAIMQLVTFLATILQDGDAAAFIKNMAHAIGMETDGKSMGIALEDKPSGKLSLNAGIVSLTQDMISMVCDIRFPVTYKIEDVMDPLSKKAAELSFDLQVPSPTPSLYFPKDHPLIMTLQEAFHQETGIVAEPIAIGGGTYAKTMPNVVAFGSLLPGQPEIYHQPNEYMGVDDILLNAKIFAQALYKLGNATL